MSTFYSTFRSWHITKIYVMKLVFSQYANIQCPDVLNTIDQTSGNINVPACQCLQSSP